MNSSIGAGPVTPPVEKEEVRTFADPNLMTVIQFEELTVEETQKILIEDPPAGLD
jgi:hypothetical protein